jgi:hypothetical protein
MSLLLLGRNELQVMPGVKLLHLLVPMHLRGVSYGVTIVVNKNTYNELKNERQVRICCTECELQRTNHPPNNQHLQLPTCASLRTHLNSHKPPNSQPQLHLQYPRSALLPKPPIQQYSTTHPSVTSPIMSHITTHVTNRRTNESTA